MTPQALKVVRCALELRYPRETYWTNWSMVVFFCVCVGLLICIARSEGCSELMLNDEECVTSAVPDCVGSRDIFCPDGLVLDRDRTYTWNIEVSSYSHGQGDLAGPYHNNCIDRELFHLLVLQRLHWL